MAFGSLAMADPFGFSQQSAHYMAAMAAASSSAASSAASAATQPSFTPYMTQAHLLHQHNHSHQSPSHSHSPYYQHQQQQHQQALAPKRRYAAEDDAAAPPSKRAALQLQLQQQQLLRQQQHHQHHQHQHRHHHHHHHGAEDMSSSSSSWSARAEDVEDEESAASCSHSSPALSTPGASPRLCAGTPATHEPKSGRRELTPAGMRKGAASSARALLPARCRSSESDSESGSNSAFDSEDEEDERETAAALQQAGADASAQRFVFDGHSAPLTWKQSMLLRERAQKKFLTLRRGRRASRAVRRRREEMGLTADGPDDVESGAVDTKCPQCGKSYRQNNSFYKHLYEHHAKWDYVSETFNLSKHQQVMMMQGAELLLSLHQPLTQGLHPLVRF